MLWKNILVLWKNGSKIKNVNKKKKKLKELYFCITQKNHGKILKATKKVNTSRKKFVCVWVCAYVCVCVCVCVREREREREISVHAFFYQATNLLEGFLQAHWLELCQWIPLASK